MPDILKHGVMAEVELVCIGEKLSFWNIIKKLLGPESVISLVIMFAIFGYLAENFDVYFREYRSVDREKISSQKQATDSEFEIFSERNQTQSFSDSSKIFNHPSSIGTGMYED